MGTLLSYQKINFDYSTLLGEGSNGTFVCLGSYGSKPVAVKVVRENAKTKQEPKEISFLKKLKHKNIIKYYGHNFNPKFGIYLLAFELCDTTLKAHFEKNRENINGICISRLEIMFQTTNGVAYLHNENIIHRDLKPSNILLSVKDRKVIVKIADLGISKWLDINRSGVTFTSAVGTANWTAPEILDYFEYRQRREKDPTITAFPYKLKLSSDIFSLGCVFYYVVSGGDHPFGSTTREITDRIDHKRPPTIDFKNDKPNGSCLLVQKMIAHQPDDRPTVSEIQAHNIFLSFSNCGTGGNSQEFQEEDFKMISTTNGRRRNGE